MLRYNHHLLKGNLDEKKVILKCMADDIENDRKKLNEINNSFSVKLFRMLNAFVRHNNDDNEYIKGVSGYEVQPPYNQKNDYSPYFVEFEDTEIEKDVVIKIKN